MVLSIPEGQFAGILGPNGSGKTTLLDIMAGLITPDCGTVKLDNRPINSYRPKELARTVALVPQDFNIRFDFTVRQVVEMGRYPYLGRFQDMGADDINTIKQVMKELDIQRFAERPVTALSGGERQRVAVARALAQTTKALILDEATSSLDIQHSLSIMDIIRQKVKQEGLTAVASIHDINLAAQYCDILIFLKNGDLMAMGNVDDLMEESLLSQLFDMEVDIHFDSFLNRKQASFRLPGTF